MQQHEIAVPGRADRFDGALDLRHRRHSSRKHHPPTPLRHLAHERDVVEVGQATLK